MATFFLGKNLPSDRMRGSSTASFGRPFTYSCSDSVGHTADVRNRTRALLYCPQNPEHLARDHWPFVRKPVVFSRSCARRIPLLNRFPNV